MTVLKAVNHNLIFARSSYRREAEFKAPERDAEGIGLRDHGAQPEEVAHSYDEGTVFLAIFDTF